MSVSRSNILIHIICQGLKWNKWEYRTCKETPWKMTLNKTSLFHRGKQCPRWCSKRVRVLLIGGSERPEAHEWELMRKQWKNSQQNNPWERNSLFTWCWENWYHTCQRVNLEPYLTTYAEINWKWVRDLGLGAKTVNILKILEEKSSWYWIWNDFVDMTTKSTDSNKQVDELDFLKIKNFRALKGTNRKVKTQPTQQEWISTNKTPEQG